MNSGIDSPVGVGEERQVVGCTDAFGRPRALEVYLNDKGRVCFRTPPGESALLDRFQLDELLSHLEELRRRTR